MRILRCLRVFVICIILQLSYYLIVECQDSIPDSNDQEIAIIKKQVDQINVGQELNNSLGGCVMLRYGGLVQSMSIYLAHLIHLQQKNTYQESQISNQYIRGISWVIVVIPICLIVTIVMAIIKMIQYRMIYIKQKSGRDIVTIKPHTSIQQHYINYITKDTQARLAVVLILTIDVLINITALQVFYDTQLIILSLGLLSQWYIVKTGAFSSQTNMFWKIDRSFTFYTFEIAAQVVAIIQYKKLIETENSLPQPLIMNYQSTKIGNPYNDSIPVIYIEAFNGTYGHPPGYSFFGGVQLGAGSTLESDTQNQRNPAKFRQLIDSGFEVQMHLSPLGMAFQIILIAFAIINRMIPVLLGVSMENILSAQRKAFFYRIMQILLVILSALVLTLNLQLVTDKILYVPVDNSTNTIANSCENHYNLNTNQTPEGFWNQQIALYRNDVSQQIDFMQNWIQDAKSIFRENKEVETDISVVWNYPSYYKDFFGDPSQYGFSWLADQVRNSSIIFQWYPRISYNNIEEDTMLTRWRINYNQQSNQRDELDYRNVTGLEVFRFKSQKGEKGVRIGEQKIFSEYQTTKIFYYDNLKPRNFKSAYRIDGNSYVKNETLETQWAQWYNDEAKLLQQSTRYYNQDQIEFLTYLKYLNATQNQDFKSQYDSYVKLLQDWAYLTEISTISDILDNPIIAYVTLGNLQIVNPLQAYFVILQNTTGPQDFINIQVDQFFHDACNILQAQSQPIIYNISSFCEKYIQDLSQKFSQGEEQFWLAVSNSSYISLNDTLYKNQTDNPVGVQQQFIQTGQGNMRLLNSLYDSMQDLIHTLSGEIQKQYFESLLIDLNVDGIQTDFIVVKTCILLFVWLNIILIFLLFMNERMLYSYASSLPSSIVYRQNQQNQLID